MIAAILNFLGASSSTKAIKPWNDDDTPEVVAERHGISVAEATSAMITVAKFYKEKGVFKD